MGVTCPVVVMWLGEGGENRRECVPAVRLNRTGKKKRIQDQRQRN